MTTSTLPEPPDTADIADAADTAGTAGLALGPDNPSVPELPVSLEDPSHPAAAHLRRPLPLWVRCLVLVVGWVVLLVGVAGLVLPGIQGIATILAGLAILSVSSELAHRWMRRALQRWPKLSRRVESFRTRIHNWLHRMVQK